MNSQRGSVRHRPASVFDSLFAVALWASLVAPTSLLASAILIPAGDAALREDLNRLADRGVISLSLTTWPLPQEAVSAALAKVEAGKLAGADAAAYARVLRILEPTSGAAPVVRAAGKSDEYLLPRGFQSESRARSEFGLVSALSADAATLSLGVNAIHKLTPEDDDDVSFDGSYASLRFLGQIAALSQIDRWWGPSDQGSAILGSAARPFPALSLQRATQRAPESRWLSWIGPWNYQLLFGQLQDYDSVPHTKIVGLRVNFKPFDLIDIGASRTMQWGGTGRPENWDSFWDAFIGESNTRAPDDSDDPANQLGGFDLRLTPFGRRIPLALFAEYIGEDETEAHHWPAAVFGTIGFEFRFDIGETSFLWRAEATDTTAHRDLGKNPEPGITYRNSAYPGGYYQEGLSLGHPIGGDGELYATSLVATDGRGIRYEARFLHTQVNDTSQDVNLAYPLRDTIKAGILKLGVPIKHARIEAVAAVQDSERFGTEPVGSLNLSFDFRKK